MCPCGCGCGSRSEDDRKDVVRDAVIMIPCRYCSTLFSQTASFCPNCGAKRTT